MSLPSYFTPQFPSATGKLWQDAAVACIVIFVISRVIKFYDGIRVSSSIPCLNAREEVETEVLTTVTSKSQLHVFVERELSPRHPIRIRPARLPWRRTAHDLVEPRY